MSTPSAPWRHILAATDGSAAADRAVDLALRLARAWPATPVTLLTVVPDYGTQDIVRMVFANGPDTPELRQALGAEGVRRAEAVRDRHDTTGLAVDCRSAVGDDPSHEILQFAREQACDLIVMGSRGHGPMRSALLGSQTLKVMSRSHVPVLVAGAGSEGAPGDPPGTSPDTAA